MIKITHEQFGTGALQMAMQKLKNSPMKSPAAFRIVHVLKRYETKLKEFREILNKEVFEPFSVGGIKEQTPPKGKSKALDLPFQVIEGKEEAAKNFLEEFGKKVIEIDCKKIPFNVLFEVAEWSPRELEVLEPFVEQPHFD